MFNFMHTLVYRLEIKEHPFITDSYQSFTHENHKECYKKLASRL